MDRDVFVGILVGVFAMIFLNAGPWSDASKYKEAIKNCEKSLPRDRNCNVVGVPQ